MNTYIVGTLVEIEATFRDQDGNLVDPTTIEAAVRLPDLTVIVLNNQVEHVSLGVFKVTYTPVQNGLHAYRYDGLGAVIAAAEGSFMAQTSFPT